MLEGQPSTRTFPGSHLRPQDSGPGGDFASLCRTTSWPMFLDVLRLPRSAARFPRSTHPGPPPPPAAGTMAPGRAEGSPHRSTRALDLAQPARREVPPVSQPTPQRVVRGHLCFPGGRQGECQGMAPVPFAAGAFHPAGPLPGHRSGRGTHLPAAG
ncbi:hypothetical protein V5799_020648 [Amblyomma americanum]|uniref:Uncharacterized protein n=1 Tax=Amblyomma americanum TaxID=6943 RepID=A0AAQ4ETD9_AMBAM